MNGKGGVPGYRRPDERREPLPAPTRVSFPLEDTTYTVASFWSVADTCILLMVIVGLILGAVAGLHDIRPHAGWVPPPPSTSRCP